ncbi:hypothetical protein DIPPA_22104 [Diplonema papillatum]|nr:hypothetical protein DIPPA_22104 [Diplonema papillatum]
MKLGVWKPCVALLLYAAVTTGQGFLMDACQSIDITSDTTIPVQVAAVLGHASNGSLAVHVTMTVTQKISKFGVPTLDKWTYFEVTRLDNDSLSLTVNTTEGFEAMDIAYLPNSVTFWLFMDTASPLIDTETTFKLEYGDDTALSVQDVTSNLTCALADSQFVHDECGGVQDWIFNEAVAFKISTGKVNETEAVMFTLGFTGDTDWFAIGFPTGVGGMTDADLYVVRWLPDNQPAVLNYYSEKEQKPTEKQTGNIITVTSFGTVSGQRQISFYRMRVVPSVKVADIRLNETMAITWAYGTGGPDMTGSSEWTGHMANNVKRNSYNIPICAFTPSMNCHLDVMINETAMKVYPTLGTIAGQEAISFTFEVESSNQWYAIGFPQTSKMSNADIYTISFPATGPEVKSFWSPAPGGVAPTLQASQAIVYGKSMTLIRPTYGDGVVDSTHQPIELGKKTVVTWATGPGIPGTTWTKHSSAGQLDDYSAACKPEPPSPQFVAGDPSECPNLQGDIFSGSYKASVGTIDGDDALRLEITLSMEQSSGYIAFGFNSESELGMVNMDIIMVRASGLTWVAEDMFSSDKGAPELDTAAGGTSSVFMEGEPEVINGNVIIRVLRKLAKVDATLDRHIYLNSTGNMYVAQGSVTAGDVIEPHGKTNVTVLPSICAQNETAPAEVVEWIDTCSTQSFPFEKTDGKVDFTLGLWYNKPALQLTFSFNTGTVDEIPWIGIGFAEAGGQAMVNMDVVFVHNNGTWTADDRWSKKTGVVPELDTDLTGNNNVDVLSSSVSGSVVSISVVRLMEGVDSAEDVALSNTTLAFYATGFGNGVSYTQHNDTGVLASWWAVCPPPSVPEEPAWVPNDDIACQPEAVDLFTEDSYFVLTRGLWHGDPAIQLDVYLDSKSFDSNNWLAFGYNADGNGKMEKMDVTLLWHPSTEWVAEDRYSVQPGLPYADVDKGGFDNVELSVVNVNTTTIQLTVTRPLLTNDTDHDRDISRLTNIFFAWGSTTAGQIEKHKDVANASLYFACAGAEDDDDDDDGLSAGWIIVIIAVGVFLLGAAVFIGCAKSPKPHRNGGASTAFADTIDVLDSHDFQPASELQMHGSLAN